MTYGPELLGGTKAKCVSVLVCVYYSIPFRVQAASQTRSNQAVRPVKVKLRESYKCEPPDGRIITQWMEKLFETGSLVDRPQAGRPSEHGDSVHDVEQSVGDDPQLPTKKRSTEMGIPRTTLRRILKDDLGFRPRKPCQVQFLSEAD